MKASIDHFWVAKINIYMFPIITFKLPAKPHPKSPTIAITTTKAFFSKMMMLQS